ncbi:LON peptidase N-terminal domain and RING finger protein 1-like isoform X2 [Mytilus edulis]|uniref:LON peptidase N-terminal domain and RING finger protein 1-like isoform X1 n=1 Tax=Mytilus edulis TaxID=6550 RepID=UPI0039EEAC69
MVDLARQAFNTNNFLLAVEIFERTISQNGPSVDLYLGLADSFAKTGQFNKAFETYSSASRLGSISPEKLKHLVTSLVNCVKGEKNPEQMFKQSQCLFTCLICRGLLKEPVTIPCGHTYCRSCLEKGQSKSCKNCGVVHYYLNVSRLKTNFLISRVVQQWFPSECRAADLKSKGNTFMERHKFERAIVSYSEALELAPTDHLSLSNRSHAYALLENYKAALEDAEKVIEIRPDWPKAYFRKGRALFGLDQYEDAVVALLQCLALDPSIASAKDYLSKALHKIITPLPPDDPKAAALHQQMHPSVLQQLIMSNFQTTQLHPCVTMEHVMQLKNIINDTLEAATNFEGSSNMDQKPNQGRVEKICYRNSQHEAMEQGNERTKCASAPNSRSTSPILPSKNPRFRDDLSLSLKRSRNPSGPCPLSPSREPPAKMFDMAGCSERDSLKDESERKIPGDLLNRDDFDCSLCYRLLYDPVTTPCGHVFCRRCLDRCLDHQSSCPLCKSSLAEYLAERRQSVTESVQGILRTYFTDDYEERKKIHEEELVEFTRMSVEGTAEIPVFVCTQAFPGIACPLHIFEPRYRLMIRQCMESGTRQFGMVVTLTDDDDNFSDFGTMLEIRDVQFFPDGRSIVDTIGGRRFKVSSRGKRDGYNTAKVEFIFDKMPPQERFQEIKEVQNDVYNFAKIWFDALPGLQREQIHKHCGQFPALDEDFTQYPNGPRWLWWLVSVLPLNPQIQLSLLAMVQLKERLEGVKKVIQYMSSRRRSQ